MADGNNRGFILGAFLGSVVGASIALILAPKSGRELRGDLNQGTKQVIGKAGDFKDTVQERSSEYTEKALEKGSEWKDKSVEFSKQAAESTSKLTKEVTEKTSNLTEDV